MPRDGEKRREWKLRPGEKEKSTSRYVCFDIFRIECTRRAFTRVKGGAACHHCFSVSTGIVVKRVSSWYIIVEPSSVHRQVQFFWEKKIRSESFFINIFINYSLLLFLSIKLINVELILIYSWKISDDYINTLCILFVVFIHYLYRPQI